MKSRILLVGDYNRSDFIFVAKQLKGEAKFYFIEYLNEKNLINKECLEYGDVIYWKDFSDGFDLLKKINPTKVVFYFIESFNHVALKVASKILQIPTYHLEHGLRFSLAYYQLGNDSKQIDTKKTFSQRLNQFSDLVNKYNNRQFYKRTVRKSPEKEKKFLKEYFKIRRTNGIFQTFQILQSSFRLPDTYISFSPIIFNFHRDLENLAEEYPVKYIGIPQFDFFIKWKDIFSNGKDVLFIDQPLHEQSIYEWTVDKKMKFLHQLFEITSQVGKKLYIKYHPMNDLSLYASIEQEPGVEIVAENWDAVVPAINTVLGFSSTLLLPFMAMDAINCFLLEMHPKQGEEPYSQFLLNSGACHAAFSFEDLEEKLKDWDKWNMMQKQHKEQFVHDYMYKFDGKSSERLKSILLSEAS